MITFRPRLMLLAALAFAATVSGSACAQNAGDDSTRVPGFGSLLHNVAWQNRSLRRTEFLQIDRLERSLQVAFVVESNERSADTFQGLRSTLRSTVEGLQRAKTSVSVAIVIYDDDSARLVTEGFQGDVAAVEAALDAETRRLQPRGDATGSGKAVDQGLETALSLWRGPAEPGVSRWMIVWGEAPPEREGSDSRKVSTSELVDLARDRQTVVYGIANTPPEVATGRDHSSLRSLIGELAWATGGHAMNAGAPLELRYWMAPQQILAPITQADIEEVRRLSQQQAGEAIRIAVLPHLPLGKMSFEEARKEVVLATLFRERLSRLGGVDIVASMEVEQAFSQLEAGTADLKETLSRLGSSLKADYVIWGFQKSHFDSLVTETGLYDSGDGSLIARSVKSMKDGRNDAWPYQLFQDFCAECAQALGSRMKMAHAAVFAQPTRGSQLELELMSPLAHDERAQASILAALALLEESLAYSMNEHGPDGERDPAADLLLEAIGHLQHALSVEPDSPYAHLLMADCYHNLDRKESGSNLSAQVIEHLEQAYKWLDYLPSDADPARLEIEAQYALLVVKDVEAAARRYRELAGRTVGRGGRFDLRAHWMLAGIHLGEWDAASYGWNLVDMQQAREHILSILAFWPSSPEANFYQKCRGTRDGEPLEVPVGDAQLARSY